MTDSVPIPVEPDPSKLAPPPLEAWEWLILALGSGAALFLFDVAGRSTFPTFVSSGGRNFDGRMEITPTDWAMLLLLVPNSIALAFVPLVYTDRLLGPIARFTSLERGLLYVLGFVGATPIVMMVGHFFGRMDSEVRAPLLAVEILAMGVALLLFLIWMFAARQRGASSWRWLPLSLGFPVMVLNCLQVLRFS